LSCQRAEDLVHPYVDGELDILQAAEVERHLDQCEDCNQAYRNQITLRSSFKDTSLYYRAPQDLQWRISSSLQRKVKAEVPPNSFRWAWVILAASLPAGLFLIGVLLKVVPVIRRPASDEVLVQEIVSDHIRSLQMNNHLTDVLSSDQHTVKPWFNGKIDFSPPVNDFASEDFRLYGGRLEYVNNKAAATLIYQRRLHYINLYIWPAEQMQTAVGIATQRQGYNLLHWTDKGMNFWAVSDLSSAELGDFARLIQQAK